MEVYDRVFRSDLTRNLYLQKPVLSLQAVPTARGAAALNGILRQTEINITLRKAELMEL